MDQKSLLGLGIFGALAYVAFKPQSNSLTAKNPNFRAGYLIEKYKSNYETITDDEFNYLVAGGYISKHGGSRYIVTAKGQSAAKLYHEDNAETLAKILVRINEKTERPGENIMFYDEDTLKQLVAEELITKPEQRTHYYEDTKQESKYAAAFLTVTGRAFIAKWSKNPKKRKKNPITQENSGKVQDALKQKFIAEFNVDPELHENVKVIYYPTTNQFHIGYRKVDAPDLEDSTSANNFIDSVIYYLQDVAPEIDWEGTIDFKLYAAKSSNGAIIFKPHERVF